MRLRLLISAIVLFSSCDSLIKKSTFECFNKVEIKPTYDNVLEQEKHIKDHLDDYFNQFSKFYSNAFEKLDNQSNILGLFSKVVGSIWDGKGMIGLESRHQSLKDKYNENVLKQIELEIQKINILIYYAYYERINYYRSTIPNEGEPLNSSNIHPRFFLFEYANKDKLYNEFIERTSENLRQFEMNLAKVRVRKAFHSLYLDSNCELSPLVNELLSYLDNPKQSFQYQYEIEKLGLSKVTTSWFLNDKLEQEMVLWSEKKKNEYESYKEAYFHHLINEISTLEIKVDLNSSSKDFINEKP